MNDVKTVLDARGIWKSYGEGETYLSILRGVDLTVREGEVAAIMGPSGSGKSTLLHVVGLLDEPDQGTVVITGEDAWSAGEKRRAVLRNRSLGFVFQFHHLLDEFSLVENVAMPAMLAGTPRQKSLDLAGELLREVDLEGRAGHFPSEVSGGERQRAAVARALICGPAVVLADEPTGNLDESSSALVEDMLFELSGSRRQAFVIVTHSRALADRAHVRYHLTDGRLTSF
jgi:lipoprotein-releasing system ATP-binding protein